MTNGKEKKMLDILIKGGDVYRGDGGASLRCNVGLKGDTIVYMGQETPEATRVIDARGLCVAPGFVDIHTHSELTLMVNPLGQSKLMQGVTTEVMGNCGLTAFPVADEFRRQSLAFIDVPGMTWDWRNTEEYLERLQAVKPAVNMVQLVGHGSIRAAVIGYENRLARPDEIEKMQQMLARMFEMGFHGLSTGLGYAPDFYSDEDELCALAQVVKDYDRVFAFHVRGERRTLFKAVAEAINVSRRTGANVEVSHLKCPDTLNMGRMPQLLEMFDQAALEGLPVNFDQYPYTAGSAYLGLAFPPHAHEGGMEKLLQRLENPQTRRQIEVEMMAGCGEWSSLLAPFQGENILIAGVEHPGDVRWEGKWLPQIAGEMGCSVETAVCEMMLKARGKVDIVMFQQDEKDLELAMKHPMGMIGSDGFAMDQGERIRKGKPHPRSFGTYARVLAEYVRERKVLSMEEAIRRMTGAPAAKVRLHNRGLLREGFFGDVVIFDADAVKDAATYKEPCQFAQGIQWVIVNGRIAKTPEGLTGVRAGRLVLREDQSDREVH